MTLWLKDNCATMCLEISKSQRRHRFTVIHAIISKLPSCFTFYYPGMERKLTCRRCLHSILQKLQLSGKVGRRIGTCQLEAALTSRYHTCTNNGFLTLSHFCSNVTSSLDLPLAFQLKLQPPRHLETPSHCPILYHLNVVCSTYKLPWRCKVYQRNVGLLFTDVSQAPRMCQLRSGHLTDIWINEEASEWNTFLI